MSVNLYNATTDTLKNVAGDIVNPKSVNNTIAPAEETTTASRAYNIGEQFFLNDVLYKATDNIAQGDTITVGTNCSASDKLTEQIDSLNNDLGSKSSASAVTGNDAFSKIATLNASLTEVPQYGTLAYSETIFTMQTSTVNYAVEHSATYCITVFSGSSTHHDVSVNIANIDLASGYLVNQYERINAQVPLRKGTRITIIGNIGDGVIITYLRGVSDAD